MNTLFSETSLLEGIPGILAREPWAVVIALLFDREKRKYLEQLRQSQRYTGIRELPERLLDYLALDGLLYYYRDTDSLEKKQENIENAWLIRSQAGTTFAVQKIADIFFEHMAKVDEWWEYGGEADHYRVVVNNRSPEWTELEKFLEVSYYFKRLSQMLDGIEVKLREEAVPLCFGAVAVEHRTVCERAYKPLTHLYCGAIAVEHRKQIITPRKADT